MVASADRVVFKWNSVTTSCEAVSYLINASNCGHCPNVTNDTTVTCTGFSLDSQMCLLSVQTAVCGDNTGNESRYVEVALKGMPVPNHYNIAYLHQVLCQYICIDST